MTRPDNVVGTSTMIAIYPPEEFLHLASKHADPALIHAGLHVTLFYIGDTDPAQDGTMLEGLSNVLKSFRTSLTMKVNGPGLFLTEGNAGFVRKLDMTAVGLEFLRTAVLKSMWKLGLVGKQDHGFSPHLTLQYHDTPEVPVSWEKCALEPYIPFEVSTLYLVREDAVIGSVEFGGEVTLGGVNPGMEAFKDL